METADLLCFSHARSSLALRSLLVPIAYERRVFFIDAPVFQARAPRVRETQVAANMWRVSLTLSAEKDAAHAEDVERLLMDVCHRRNIESPVHWHLTPCTLALAARLPRCLVVYDSMDDIARLLERPLYLRPSRHGTLYSVDATTKKWGEQTVQRLQRLIRGAENAELPPTRRVRKHNIASYSVSAPPMAAQA